MGMTLMEIFRVIILSNMENYLSTIMTINKKSYWSEFSYFLLLIKRSLAFKLEKRMFKIENFGSLVNKEDIRLIKISDFKYFCKFPIDQGFYSRDINLPEFSNGQIKLILKRALGNSCKFIFVDQNTKICKSKFSSSFHLNEKNYGIPDCVYISIFGEHEKNFQRLTIGPLASKSLESKSFRDLWGKKACIRKFKDGRVFESIVWKKNEIIFHNHKIIDNMIRHLTALHLPVGTKLFSATSCFDSVVYCHFCKNTNKAIKDLITSAVEEEYQASNLLNMVSDHICQCLQHLASMTLPLKSIQLIDSVSRHTSAYQPPPNLWLKKIERKKNNLLRDLKHFKILAEINSSKRWINKPKAYFKMKSALYLHLALRIKENYGFNTFIHKDNIDILTSGFTFRLFLHCDIDYLHNHSSIYKFTRLEKNYHVWLNQTIDVLKKTYKVLTYTIKIAKRWMFSNWMSSHLSEETVELLVLYSFTSSNITLHPPGSYMAGMLRFLSLLAYWPFHSHLMFVDPLFEINDKKKKEIIY